MQYSGLLGCNIKYSMSPEIHNSYYKKNNIELRYELFDIKEKYILKFINNLRINKIVGFNVTIPYKQIIMKYLTSVEDTSAKIGAVNTVAVTDENLIGYNTDYFGFIKSLKDNGIIVNGLNALIIGWGGAAKCIAQALTDLKVKNIVVLVRNPEKVNCKFNVLNMQDINDLGFYDMIINCTPLGGANYPTETPIKLNNIKIGALAYDLNYNPTKSKFLVEAEKNGASIMNGREMLVNQAYYSIDIWTENLHRKGLKSEFTKRNVGKNR